MTGPTAACTHWDGTARQYCRAVGGVRRFRTGLRCPRHTPAAVAGKPEAPAPATPQAEGPATPGGPPTPTTGSTT